MSAVELEISTFVAYCARGVYFLKLVVHVYLVVIERRKARVDEVLHALRKRRSVERLNKF